MPFRRGLPRVNTDSSDVFGSEERPQFIRSDGVVDLDFLQMISEFPCGLLSATPAGIQARAHVGCLLVTPECDPRQDCGWPRSGSALFESRELGCDHVRLVSHSQCGGLNFLATSARKGGAVAKRKAHRRIGDAKFPGDIPLRHWMAVSSERGHWAPVISD